MQIQMNLNANANTNAMQLHTGADANIKRTHCGCRCRRKRSNCNANANTDANPISGIDKRGRQTKLCDINSGTNHHLMQWKTCNCKILKMMNAVAKKNDTCAWTPNNSVFWNQETSMGKRCVGSHRIASFWIPWQPSRTYGGFPYGGPDNLWSFVDWSRTVSGKLMLSALQCRITQSTLRQCLILSSSQ